MVIYDDNKHYGPSGAGRSLYCCCAQMAPALTGSEATGSGSIDCWLTRSGQSAENPSVCLFTLYFVLLYTVISIAAADVTRYPRYVGAFRLSWLLII